MASVIEHGNFTCFGGISVKGQAVATTIVSDSVYYQFLFFDRNSPSRGTTPDHTNDHITIEVPGTYCVLLNASAIASNGDEVHIEVKINNGSSTLEDIHARSTGRGAGVKTNLGAHGFPALAVGDTVELWIENETSTDDITVEDASLSVLRVGS